jgi:hypothetical protein
MKAWIKLCCTSLATANHPSVCFVNDWGIAANMQHRTYSHEAKFFFRRDGRRRKGLLMAPLERLIGRLIPSLRRNPAEKTAPTAFSN